MKLPKQVVALLNRGPDVQKVSLVLLVCGVCIFLLSRSFSSSGKEMFSGLYNYRYAQLKLALEEKDGALAEALDLLEQTQQAQQLQEQALDELRQQLAKYTAEITQAQEAMRKRDIALKLKEESDRIATTAVQSSQLCRQEAAAALQQKDVQMMQVNTALDRAKQDMSSLQGLVTTAEERLKSREADLSKAIREHKVAATRSKNQMQEHGGSVAYLAEKARMTQSKHAENLEHARSERSCQPDIERLTAEIQSLAKWKREAIHNGCRISPSPRRSLAGADE